MCVCGRTKPFLCVTMYPNRKMVCKSVSPPNNILFAEETEREDIERGKAKIFDLK